MKYVTYYETEEMISAQEYQDALLKLNAENTQTKRKIDEIQCYHFISCLQEDSRQNYSICRQNKQKIYLEKTSNQGGLTWRESEELTPQDADRMKHKELKWMKEDSRHLVRDFYLQIVLNGLQYDSCESYFREEYPYQKNDRIVFHWKIQKTRGHYTVDILPEGEVLMKVRRAKTIPRVIQNMMQGLEFAEEKPVYA